MIQSPRRVLVLAAVLASAFALSACEKEVSIGDNTIDRDELELESSRTLTKQYGEKPASIDCPDDLKAEVDATETCELVDQSGNHYDMKVTVTSVDDDGNAKFNIKVGGIKQMGSVPE
ncbi:MAG TPA: DUF4333 domain-containing protein [Solirubrobacterales bacterium]|mgnify:CR=1 FL=1|nr:DUF4333 domain-containing protein [Solirubrobacterales bacterium]HMW45460.1 DUF4333 domain-containing protein [Solirubrobacterales bacterium]HNA45279.1 DUF4333 domain-containing protein [Solirubrobacterales bacterium]HNC06383.1 DUF4333 domain-containing protein [Solirubrobacterales bacterium]HNC14494.1 DUF4333 domain-containing protein [Solirubrobacterales bacterium]